jgi:hypothetical protein
VVKGLSEGHRDIDVNVPWEQFKKKHTCRRHEVRFKPKLILIASLSVVAKKSRKFDISGP